MVGVNVVEVSSLVSLLSSLVDAATEAAMAKQEGWQAHADYLVYCVLAALPWGAADLHDRSPEALTAVLATCEEYLGRRERGGDPLLRLTPLTASSSEEATKKEEEEEDFIEELWGRVSDLAQSGNWTVTAVPQLAAPFEHKLATAIHHDLPTMPIPGPPQLPTGSATQRKAVSMAKYPPRGRLRVLAKKHTEADRPPMERFVVEEYVLDTLQFWAAARAECVTQLASVPVPPSWNVEYIIAETLFAQLLRLPSPGERPLLYGIVLADLCRLRATTGSLILPKMAPALAATVGQLFRRVPTMDVECRSRLSEWLALHLSNFSFHWPWDRWAHVAELPPHAPQRVFVEETLQREIRLSYWDRIHSTLPEELQKLMPPKPEAQSRYASEVANGGGVEGSEVALAQELMGMIKRKLSVAELEDWVREALVDKEAVQAEPAVRVVGTCVLILCSKSWTHLVTLLERFGSLLRLVAVDRVSQQTLVQTTADIWATSPQHLAMTVERLLSHRLVSTLAIVDWVFCAWTALLTGSAPSAVSSAVRVRAQPAPPFPRNASQHSSAVPNLRMVSLSKTPRTRDTYHRL